jgi:hypothetical protein
MANKKISISKILAVLIVITVLPSKKYLYSAVINEI